jgi:hypothetical protein
MPNHRDYGQLQLGDAGSSLNYATTLTCPNIQIRACWSAPQKGGPLVKGASAWQEDTPKARATLRKTVEEGNKEYGDGAFWLDAWVVSDVLRPDVLVASEAYD